MSKKIPYEIEFEKKFVLKGPQGAINETAIASATTFVDKFAAFAKGHQTGAKFAFPRPNNLWEKNSDWKVWMVKKGEFAGTWPKRYVSYCYKQYGIRPPEKLVSQIGQALANSANLQDEYLVDFTYKCDWKPGTFGESTSSCWWGDYKGARIGLFQNGGFAMRFYTSTGKGTGRCWVYPHNGLLYMFNAYHNDGVKLYTMACLLSTYIGTGYKYIQGLDAERAYVNGNCGFILGPQDKLERCTSSVCLKFAINCDDDDDYCCTYCDDRFGNEDDGDYYEGEWFCQSCFESEFQHCNNCGNVHRRDDMQEGPDDKYYCDRCIAKKFSFCEKCEKWVNETVSVDGKNLCEDCTDTCKVCGTVFDTDEECPTCIEKEGEQ